MRYGVCVAGPEPVATLATAGYDFFELPAAALRPFDDDATAAPALRMIADAPLPVEAFNSLIPGRLPLLGPQADRAALVAYLRRTFARMAAVGGAVAVLGSGAARRIPEGMAREAALSALAAIIAEIGELATAAGITLALEPLNRGECNVFNTIAEARAFLSDYGLSGVRLLADLHHLTLEDEPLAEVTAVAPLLAHVHVAGGGRQAPHIPGYDYSGFLATLHAIGYNTRISAECSWQDLAAEAGPALKFMRG